ncbi:hypothetical protein C8R47DRAFT_525850 [Mycena vitilis]|nr:hypothetical protein C8R47DRAFT_525850 [Mycena vitilis]
MRMCFTQHQHGKYVERSGTRARVLLLRPHSLSTSLHCPSPVPRKREREAAVPLADTALISGCAYIIISLTRADWNFPPRRAHVHPIVFDVGAPAATGLNLAFSRRRSYCNYIRLLPYLFIACVLRTESPHSSKSYAVNSARSSGQFTPLPRLLACFPEDRSNLDWE